MRYLLIFAFLISGCASYRENSKIREDRKKVDKELTSEVSLKQDRSELETLRSEIPQDKKQSNDELALFLNLTNEVKDPPGKIRERFQNLIQKKREVFRRKVEKVRENYKKDELKRKDEFNADQRKKREAFKLRKLSAERTKEFFDQQEQNRRDFYSREQDRRKDFEDQIDQHSKDFNAYMKERMDSFIEQMRIYETRYREKQKDSLPNSEPTP